MVKSLSEHVKSALAYETIRSLSEKRSLNFTETCFLYGSIIIWGDNSEIETAMMLETKRKPYEMEWPTLALLTICYAGWMLATTWMASFWLPPAMLTATLLITLHSSLTHEALHGHPFRSGLLNEACVFPCLGLAIPYRRFRDTHLAHHHDPVLTDPYDDPETNFLDPNVWILLPNWFKCVLRFNNTLLGRLILGPAFSLWALARDDIKAVRRKNSSVILAWALQVIGVVPVIFWIYWSAMPFWAYLICAYAGFSILKIRTFLEHRAHERASGRTVIIDDRGPLSILFLKNNLHAVHHMHPRVAWYRLPGMWRENREKYLRRNDSYYYRSYWEVFRKYLFKAKDSVPHPLWPVE